jgi:hypothetical protein
MDKVILLSVIFMTMVVPTLAARDPIPVRGVRRMLLVLVIFNVVYLATLILVYVPYYPPVWSP